MAAREEAERRAAEMRPEETSSGDGGSADLHEIIDVVKVVVQPVAEAAVPMIVGVVVDWLRANPQPAAGSRHLADSRGCDQPRDPQPRRTASAEHASETLTVGMLSLEKAAGAESSGLPSALVAGRPWPLCTRRPRRGR